MNKKYIIVSIIVAALFVGGSIGVAKAVEKTKVKKENMNFAEALKTKVERIRVNQEGQRIAGFNAFSRIITNALVRADLILPSNEVKTQEFIKKTIRDIGRAGGDIKNIQKENNVLDSNNNGLVTYCFANGCGGGAWLCGTSLWSYCWSEERGWFDFGFY